MSCPRLQRLNHAAFKRAPLPKENAAERSDPPSPGELSRGLFAESGRWLGRAELLAKKGAPGRMQRLTELVPIPTDPKGSVEAP